MERKIKRKRWFDRRSKKLQRNKKSKKHKFGYKVGETKPIRKRDYYRAIAPQNFSFICNTDETAFFFMNIMQQMEKKNHKQFFYIDSSKVVHVTTDALVYILAILYNMKLSLTERFSFKGNIPENEEARTVYLESGFLNYVKSKAPHMPKSNNKMQILSGCKTDSQVAKKICDFVMKINGVDYRFTMDLYKTLIELMSNTVHHAYSGKSKLLRYWYLYAINLGVSIQFTFIDTGEGIPNTVKKKLAERISRNVSDASLIYSAFLGESRTETGLYNRGHGLPALYEKIEQGRLKKFYVLSGTGCCRSMERGGKIKLEKIEYEQEVFGTIFQFEIDNVEEERVC